ncbi:MAG: ATP-binding cassette domain-containing protein [Flavobacteriales bacterium]|nr:ATP-binding cassette domain-containing protein [Flavobacteriales bacterium]
MDEETFNPEMVGRFNSGNYVQAFRKFLDLCLDTELSKAEKRKVMDLCDGYNTIQATGEKVRDDFIHNVLSLYSYCEAKESAGGSDPNVLLRANNLTKTYESGKFKLSPFSMTVSSGELIGVVGENGNGKTTLLRIVARDLSEDQGEIEFKVGTEKDLFDVKGKVAYIPQRIPRWYGKLKNNLHFAAASRGVYGFDNEYLVCVFLTRLGLFKFKDLFWTQISSGYRTRFELARILLLRPSLLILDEPLANLDINAQETFLYDLKNLAKSKKNSFGVLFSSQQLHEVEKVADHIVFLRDGESIFNSTTDGKEMLLQNTEIEIETTDELQKIEFALKDTNDLVIRLKGSLILLSCSKDLEANELLKMLVDKGISISYFRDLSRSTKKFFNEN